VSDLAAFIDGRLECAKSTAHFAYSGVTLKDYAATHLAVIQSVSPISFPEMVEYFTQADPFEAFIHDSGLQRTEAPLTWLYWNDPAQPLDPGGNPVRDPFTFEVGYEVVRPASPLRVPSESVGKWRFAGRPAARRQSRPGGGTEEPWRRVSWEGLVSWPW
jgi:hypothetical protein